MLLLFSLLLLLFLGFLVWLGPFPDRSSRDGNADAGIVCGLGNCETSAVLSLLQYLLSTPLVRYTRADTKDSLIYYTQTLAKVKANNNAH